MSASEKPEPTEHIAYIGLGSNIEPESNLPLAVKALQQQVEVLCVSSAWRAPALGTTGPDFLNAAAKIRTRLPAEELKARVLRPIEAGLKRVRSANKNAPRTIDLDILIFDDAILDAHIWDFAHLAVPLAECAPEITAPGSGTTIQEAAQDLQRTNQIERLALELDPAS